VREQDIAVIVGCRLLNEVEVVVAAVSRYISGIEKEACAKALALDNLHVLVVYEVPIGNRVRCTCTSKKLTRGTDRTAIVGIQRAGIVFDT